MATDTNLPVHLTSFVGRERDLGEISRVLAANRLLTLVGSGGCGKTRLAVEAARRRNGIDLKVGWVTDLSEIADEHLLFDSVSAALGMVASGNEAEAAVLRRC